MLNNFFFNFKFYRCVQSGFYIDYFIKKIIEILVKNYLIYSAIFFGEKFIIEFVTKKTIDNFINLNNKKFFEKNFFYSTFFSQIIIFLCYSLSFLQILFYFM